MPLRSTSFALAARRAIVIVLAVAAPLRVGVAQRTDSTAAGVVRRADSATVARRAVRAPIVDSTPRPPISPKRAFLSSLALPGLGQARLGRNGASSFFAGIELFSIAMARKSAKDLTTAKRFERDSVFAGYTSTCTLDSTRVAVPSGSGGVRDSVTATSFRCTPPVRGALTFNRFRGGRVGARKLHYEDWLAVLVFNHLISGADAFISAQLWDLPARVAVEPDAGGAALAFSVRW